MSDFDSNDFTADFEIGDERVVKRPRVRSNDYRDYRGRQSPYKIN